MDQHERELIAFLAGDLDDEAARRFDEHLLECQRCWTAAQEDRRGRMAASRLRESAPPELADRVQFAVQMRARGKGHRWPRRKLAGGGVLAAAVAGVLAVLFAIPAIDPSPIAEVVRAAQAMPAPGGPSPSPPAAPVAVGQPTAVHGGDAQVRLQHYRVGGMEVVVATSDRPFPTPSGIRPLAPGDMRWTMIRGRVAVYCPEDHVLVAAPAPPAELVAVAAQLPRH